MLIRAGLTLIIMMLPAPALAGSALPKGFVYLRDIDPTIVQDIRYAGSHNFVGRPIRGYPAAECILSQPAANALEDVQRKLAEKELSLIVWDCYRPKRADSCSSRPSKRNDAARRNGMMSPTITR
jgi:zinc D-Ala-D-Ala dipeptidase